LSAPFRYDHRFELTVEPAALWRAIEQTDRYVDWWSWLQTFEGGGLTPGATARCVVRAPLPYSLRFDVHVEEVVPVTRVVTRIDGDLVGPARLEVTPTEGGCAARLLWELELRDPVLRPLAMVTRPAMKWAHDRVVDVGFTEFKRRALDGHGSA
jgi:uncharacterized protein YndB with AHSA1/START domain